MGRDKALLELDGVTLVERIAGCVREAAGHVTLVGAPKRARDTATFASAPPGRARAGLRPVQVGLRRERAGGTNLSRDALAPADGPGC